MAFGNRPLPSERAAAIYHRLKEQGIIDRLQTPHPDDRNAVSAWQIIQRLERAADPGSGVTVTIREIDLLANLIDRALRPLDAP